MPERHLDACFPHATGNDIARPGHDQFPPPLDLAGSPDERIGGEQALRPGMDGRDDFCASGGSAPGDIGADCFELAKRVACPDDLRRQRGAYLLRMAAISSAPAKSPRSASARPASTPSTHLSYQAGERPCASASSMIWLGVNVERAARASMRRSRSFGRSLRLSMRSFFDQAPRPASLPHTSLCRLLRERFFTSRSPQSAMVVSSSLRMISMARRTPALPPAPRP